LLKRLAVLIKLIASSSIKRDELTVVFITGSGSRTLEIVSDTVLQYAVRPVLESVEEVLGMSI